MNQINKLIDLQEKLAHMHKEHFIGVEILTPQWWFLLISTIGLWVLWLILVDRERIKLILIVGLITGLMAIIMDDIGISVAAWNYPYNLVYFTNRLNPVDLATIPVAYMLLYQYLGKWKTFLPILTGFCLFGAFIAEPIFVYFNMYIMLRWKYWYSALIYFAMGIFIKWLVDKLDKKHKLENG